MSTLEEIPKVRSPLGLLKHYFFLDLAKIAPITPDDNPIELRIFIIQGNMGVGKTTNAKTLANETKKYYGKENVNAVIAHTLDDAMHSFNSCPVQLLVVDDPLKTKGMGYATFRTQQSYENFDLLFEIRHKAWAISHMVKYVFLIICTQRLFGGLDPNFRQAASVIGLKSLTLNRADNMIIQKFLGDDGEGKQAYRLLERWDRRLYCYQKYKTKGMMVFVGRGNVRGIAVFKKSMIPLEPVWDTDNRPAFKARLEESCKEDKYRMMQIAVLATFRRFSQGTGDDLKAFLREKEGLKFNDTLADEVFSYMRTNPSATITQVQEAFGCELPARYYRHKALLELQRARSLETTKGISNVQAMIEKNQKEYEESQQQ